MAPPDPLCFAVTAPGVEFITAAELARLGRRPTVVEGGVEFEAGPEDWARANLWLRTANRVLVRVAEFRARTFFELERQAKRIAWGRFLAPGAQVAFRVTCRKSALYHSDAVAQRLFEALGERVASPSRVEPSDEATTPAQLFVVRLFKDVCTVSVDSSGDLLHMRGYRQAVGKAPLRETLAAALLLASSWDGGAPLEDPFCGSGTIPIEGALIARRIAPGLRRSFAFQRWPDFDSARWRSLLTRAEETALTTSPVPIVGADRDAGAIRSSIANAERASTQNDVSFEIRAISDVPPRNAPGLLATNPPYGVRVGDAKQLKNLYARFGDVLRHSRSGWHLMMLAADATLVRQTRLSLETSFRTSNGGIPVQALTGRVGA